MKIVSRGFPRATIQPELFRFKLHEDLRLLSFTGKDARAVLRAATANDLDELHFSKEKFAQSSLALDAAGRVLCPLTLVKPAEFSGAKLRAVPGHFLAQVPAAQLAAFQAHLARFSADAHVNCDDLTADFDQFAMFTTFPQSLQPPGELLREFYARFPHGSRREGEAPDLCFADPRGSELGFQLIACRENGLLGQLCPPARLITRESGLAAFGVHRLFAHCFEAEEMAQHLPLHFNADFTHSLAAGAAPPPRQRACVFLASRAPLADYAKEGFALDNTKLLARAVDEGFEEELAGRVAHDARGRRALLLLKSHLNLAVGLFNFLDCAQDVFPLDGLYLYRVKSRRFERFLQRARTAAARPPPAEL